MGNRKHYLVALSITTFAAIILTGVINLIIDPYATFRLITIERLNRIKPNPDHDISTIKAKTLQLVQPDALILGNSRAEVGFDPTHPAWQKNGYISVYNAAIRGSSLSTAWEMLQKSAQHHAPKFILVGVDFLDFPIAADKQVSPLKAANEDWFDDVRWNLRATMTMQALLDSATTVRRQFQNNPEQLTDLGHTPLNEYRDLARSDGYWTLFRQRAEENAKNHSRKPANLFLKDTHSSPPFEDLRRIVRYAVEHNIELQLVIYPYHAQLLVMIDELGLWQVFEEWKRQLLRIVDEETRPTGALNRITLLDFSGFSEYAQERIPPKGDNKSITQWYWEAGHFKKELGDLMLEQCFSSTTMPKPDHFGIALTDQSIESHIERQRSAKAAFKAAAPLLAAEVSELVRNARHALGGQ